ncbi:PREDICTED: F-box/LRR-repeat protein At3g58900-like isoform X3 [Nelumbo nucifera]|uniref:F-box/LRR-repeat protein At3g58900-like isoform X3 n=1 Tax=Nelumbo nucifera TaxID=4432 RepID=A0A1U8B9Q1_NELNU|nr:PREDICTED: F-box/LRR-repeat protein At3g58900-like isoform X3 [Nelumbo nucifera]
MEAIESKICSVPSKKLKPFKSEKAVESTADRISALPKAVLHYILSFLDVRSAVQTSMLSKRWRYIWTTLPYLNFDHILFLAYGWNWGGENLGMDQFLDLIDRVLFLRGGSHIQKFRLYCIRNYFDTGRLHTWTLVAARCNVEEVDIRVSAKEAVELPHCLYISESMSVLKLNLGSKRPKLVLPSSMGLPNLKILHLCSLCFVDDELTNKLLCNCPLLESLIIRYCTLKNVENLKISAPRLKNLVIETCFEDSEVYEESGRSFSCKINVSAPNLISFKCRDHLKREYTLENLYSLVNADIDMYLEEDYDNELLKLPHKRKEEYAQCMIKWLTGLSNIKALTLSDLLLKIVAEVPDVLENLPTSFFKSKYLKLKSGLSKDSIIAICYLLKHFTDIETLVLEITKRVCRWHPMYQYGDESLIYQSLEHIGKRSCRKNVL